MRNFFKTAQIIILIGSNLLIANGMDLVGNVLMRSLSLKNRAEASPYDSKDACEYCKLCKNIK